VRPQSRDESSHPARAVRRRRGHASDR
jgi:hypothetical protein